MRRHAAATSAIRESRSNFEGVNLQVADFATVREMSALAKSQTIFTSPERAC